MLSQQKVILVKLKILSACEFTFKLDKEILCALRALAVKKTSKINGFSQFFLLNRQILSYKEVRPLKGN